MKALSSYVSMQVQHKAMQSRQKHLYARGAGADSESDDEHAVGDVMLRDVCVCVCWGSSCAHTHTHTTHTHNTHTHTNTHAHLRNTLPLTT